MAVAVDQHHGFKPFNRSQRCRLQSYTHIDHNFLQLSQTNLAHSLNQAIFEGYHIHRSLSTPCLSITTAPEEDYLAADTNPRIEIVGGHDDPRARALVVEVAVALASGIHPTPVSTGLGGTYFLQNRNGDNIAVAKPVDEEPLAFNNPKGFAGRMLGQPGLKRSVRIGETGVRELAAYLLDHGGFAGVPPTALVKISNVDFHVNNGDDARLADYKIASLQRFVHHKYDAGELGSSSFSVASVHRIGIFDVRLLNLDRHAGNILVKKNDNSAELVPIDHGLCLPEWLDDPYFEWLHWPQALVPFSEHEMDYISNLDVFKDADLIRTEIPSIRESSIRVFVLCTIFLKRAAAAGLCLADIAEMMTREFRCDEENLSALEILCAQAKASLPGDGDHIICCDDWREETRKEGEMFQFDDNEGEEDTSFTEVPQLLKNHFVLPDAAAALPPLYEENDPFHDNYDDIKANENGGGDESYKVGGGFMKSVSFSVPNHNNESGGISFEELSEDEWELFLEVFEELLPDVFEAKKCTSMRQRLGTSCEF